MKKMLAIHAFLVLRQLLAWRDGLVTGALTRPARLDPSKCNTDADRNGDRSRRRKWRAWREWIHPADWRQQRPAEGRSGPRWLYRLRPPRRACRRRRREMPNTDCFSP